MKTKAALSLAVVLLFIVCFLLAPKPPTQSPTQSPNEISLKSIHTDKATHYVTKDQPDRGGWFVEMADTPDGKAESKNLAEAARGIVNSAP